MASFFMLAGTVSTEKTLADIEKLLIDNDFQFKTDDDELFVKSSSNLTFRSGFGHEYIVVADAQEQTTLTNEARLLSNSLKQNLIKHEFELYDRANELYEVIEFLPKDD